MTAAVDHDQRALGAEAAQIEEIEATGAEKAGRVRLAIGALQLRQIVQHVAD